MRYRFANSTIVALAIGSLAVGSVLAAAPVRAGARATKRPVAAIGLPALAGNWKVTAVQVEDAGVQALVKNDPSYMGAVLKITPQRLSWQPHKGGGELSDVCTTPRLAPNGLISCASGEFGPPDTKLVAVGKSVKLDWYDGATLVLNRMQ